jgi:hypothetical protein
MGLRCAAVPAEEVELAAVDSGGDTFTLSFHASLSASDSLTRFWQSGYGHCRLPAVTSNLSSKEA